MGSIWKGCFLRISLLGWRCAEYTGWLPGKWEKSTLKYMCKVFENYPKGRHQHALGKIFFNTVLCLCKDYESLGHESLCSLHLPGAPIRFILIKLNGAMVLKGQKSDLPEYSAKGTECLWERPAAFPIISNLELHSLNSRWGTHFPDPSPAHTCRDGELKIFSHSSSSAQLLPREEANNTGQGLSPLSGLIRHGCLS